MSDQVTSGTVAKPSRLEEGWTCLSASVKSGDVIQSGASWASVSGLGWAIRKCAIEPEGAIDDRLEKRDALERGGSETGSVSMAIVTSCSS